MLGKLLRQRYHHLNKILISQSALKQNHQRLQSFHTEARIVPVLKSNAYGHGIKTVALVFDQLKPDFLVVDSLYEAYELTKLKVKSRILILGYTHPNNFSIKQLPFHITVFDLEMAKSLNKHQKNCRIHIFVDTGMCREGVQIDKLQLFVQKIKKMTNLKIVGLASHFADADNPNNDSFTQKQISNYKKALKILEQENISPQFRHISASGGAFKIRDNSFNMIRAGLASYGINPLEANDPAHDRLLLKPALRFTSTLVQIKIITKGDRIGYSGTYQAKGNIKIGLLPLGYYEGVDRRLSNKGVVTINGAICSILGRVSMNMTTIDLSNVKNPRVGDKVVIYAANPSRANSLVNVAKSIGTIPYELLVRLAESIKRELV